MKRVENDSRLNDIVERLKRVYDPEQIYLFGSRARGDDGNDSDFDLLVIIPDDAPRERRGSRLAYQALRGTGVAADVLVCEPTPAPLSWRVVGSRLAYQD